MSRLFALMASTSLVLLMLLVTALPVYAVDTTPTISSFSPTAGRADANVVIAGTYFTAASVVRFNGTLVTERTVNSATKITATVPPETTSGKLTITTTYGTATSTDAFYIAPTIILFAPTKFVGGEIITITGKELSSAVKVMLTPSPGTGTMLCDFTVVNDTTITAVAPNVYGENTGTLSVQTLGGTATGSAQFTVFRPLMLEFKVDLGGGYIGPLSDVALNYKVIGPREYSGILSPNPNDNHYYAIYTLIPGNYNITIGGRHWLQRRFVSVNIIKGTDINVSLANGDANGDGQVNLFDFVVLDSKFNKSDTMADLDGDGAVTLFDYTIIDQFFGAQADL